jgi:branched-chain amino acid transport system ATP-binding protein
MGCWANTIYPEPLEMIELRIEAVSKKYGGVIALNNVSLEFRGSGVSALVGPNGAGKTTLLNLVTGFVRPDEGCFFVNGVEATNLSPQALHRLGLIRSFQEVRLVRKLSVAENVSLAYTNRRVEGYWRAVVGRCKIAPLEEQEAWELLKKFGLDNERNRVTGSLSYGQQKMLSLACCLATGSTILFLDEPVSGVDPASLLKIAGALESLREGRLVIIIEHDVKFVSDVAERVVVMDGGSVVADGRPSETLKLPGVIEAFLG